MRTPGSAGARMPPLGALAALLFLASSACLILLIAAAVVFIHPAIGAQPPQTTATVGGLDYAVTNAWLLDPKSSIDAEVARGLPAADRSLAPDEALYAVFVGVTNATGRQLPMAAHVVLRDVMNRDYTPVALGAANQYAYRPGTMAPRSQQPAPGTPAAGDMSAEGLLLVFRIPRNAYDNGPLELLVHDPADPAAVATMQVL
jgi:hypothetical protein